MRVHVADHPLITHKLSVLRNRATHSSVFRQLADELVTLLAYEATRNVAVAPVEIETPVTTMTGTRLRGMTWDHPRGYRDPDRVRRQKAALHATRRSGQFWTENGLTRKGD